MKDFDQILNSIQTETPTTETESQAAERVRRTLFGPGTAGTGQLKGCDDFRGLIPSYLQKTISDSRRMLLEDHIHECPNCRKMMDAARGEGPKVVAMTVNAKPSATRRWAIAAALAASIGVTAYAMRQYLPGTLGSGTQASVQSVNGVLYRTTSAGSTVIGEGTEIANGEEIRSALHTKATLRLNDGSKIELNERAALSVNASWSGTVIRLERGHIIVQAAKQKRGKLYVNTGDSNVSVVGTIFSVNKGTLGSRVSVVEGQVNVEQNGRTEALKPGQQSTTHPALSKSPVEAEIAWSRDAAQYMALLGELSTLQQKLENIPSNGLRYQSRTLLYMPENTKMFASIPNLGVTLVEARKIFDERLKYSEVLRNWWQSKQNDRMRVEVESILDHLQTLSNFIGDEILLFVTGDQDFSGVFIAEVRNAEGLKLVMDKFAKPGAFAYGISGNVMVIGQNQSEVARAQAMVARGGGASTAFRQRIEQTYRNGAGWIFAANLEQITPGIVSGKREPSPADLGLESMQYLVLERHDIGGKIDNRVTVSFKGERQNMASWLAAPGPMGSLQFVSPDAGGAASVLVRQPRAVVTELFAMMRRFDANFDTHLAEFRSQTGLDPVEDLAAPLGGELTLALDGPILPVPSWKLVLEVNQPQRLQASLEKIMEIANKEMTAKMALTKETVSGRTFYKIDGSRFPTEIHYSFVDSYLVMAASRALITEAIQNRQNGFTLQRSDKFRAQLPYATNPNFSAVIYHDIARTVGPAVDLLSGFVNATPEQKQSMQAVKNAQPGLIAAYAESDRITAATSGGLFGLNLGMFAGGANGGMLGPLLQNIR